MGTLGPHASADGSGVKSLILDIRRRTVSSRPITIIQVGPVVTGPRLVNFPVAGQHFELEQRVDDVNSIRATWPRPQYDPTEGPVQSTIVPALARREPRVM